MGFVNYLCFFAIPQGCDCKSPSQLLLSCVLHVRLLDRKIPRVGQSYNDNTSHRIQKSF